MNVQFITIKPNVAAENWSTVRKISHKANFINDMRIYRELIEILATHVS